MRDMVRFAFNIAFSIRVNFASREAHSALTLPLGPIVRISPYEIHINDSEYIDEIYVSGAKHKVNKYGWSVREYPQ